MKRDDNLLIAIDQSPTLRVKSSLHTWMTKNHDAFAERLSERIADWQVLAEMFGAEGLTDRYGNPPKPETARKMWQRVRKEVAAAKANPSRVVHQTRVPVATVVRPPAPPPVTAPADDEAELPIIEPRSKFSLKRPADIARPPKGS